MSIRVQNIYFGYSKEELTLRGLSLDVEQGEFVLMAGPNGAGKSTLLKMLNGILKPDSGLVTINGLDTTSASTPILASHIAVTFQNPSDQIFASTVRNEILFGPRILRRRNYVELAERSMALFHLETYASKHPYDLSAAHRKLLTIASAVATDSPILAFDEPTASLSQPERLTLLNAFNVLRSEQRTLLIVSHDLDFFIPEATTLTVLNKGTVSYQGKPYDLVTKPQVARHAGLSIPLSIRIHKLAAAGISSKEMPI